ncbi:hypothetical protein DL766_003839 [Monosporascus sp. MC13-8B]|uniref:Deacetylase sirtuin-type domain-containing protein n=1 Tax=Monosporascus cannonballus TaxID=155416 RepID=A0ABY0H0X7_9PEZI|nr:hypothetical protein DL762_007919 [Monosporascus cannonballus]RYO90608.1 hypothetical protein DL763_005283 [Monosporascus cannonballus]RYP32751.1 hypothetical protein DL766_003839 [Monosporascus sp. MC13-8B]
MDSSSSDLSDPPSSSSEPPSSPLSVLTASPIISPRTSVSYGTARPLSPPSSIPSGSTSPMKSYSDTVEAEICVNPDGAPPAKRRKTERKPRTTEHLTLQPPSELSAHDEELLDQLTSILRKKKKIVIIAGAGISVSAGIPDFRSADGLFATLRSQHKLKASGKHLFDASVYKHDSTTSSFHTMVRELAHLTRTAAPTPFHHLIASLAKEGRLLRLYSQNVDGLDTEISDFDGSLFEGPEAPLCKACEETDNVRTSHAGKRSHGIGRLRPRMVLYNEFNPDEEAIANVVKADLRARPDAIIVVGTSMKIPGVRNMVKDMCQVTRKRKDGITAWINLDSEPGGSDLKDCWDLVVQGRSDEVATLVALPHWDENIEQGAEVIIDDKRHEEALRNRPRIAVEIRQITAEKRMAVKDESRDSTPMEAKPKSIKKVQGIPTPTASPKMRPRTTLPTKSKDSQKQSKLLFPGQSTKTSTATTSRGAAKANGKAAPRKSKHTKKAAPMKPAHTLNTMLKSTKPQAAVPSKLPAKRNWEPDSSPSANARTLLHDDFSLRPRGPKKARVSLDAQFAVDTQIRQENGTYARPVTPTRSEHSSSRETISPPSKPRGELGSFID